MFDSRNDPLMDRFVADLVEGAQRNSRANGGPGVNVLVHKFAGHSGIGAAFGGPMGAALGADDGREMAAAKGSFLGGLKGTGIGTLAGGGLGALLAALGGERALAGALPGAALGGGLGGYIGNIAGAAGAGDSLSHRITDKLSSAQHEGVKAAAARFGVKEAFAGALARLAPMAGKAMGFLGKNPIGQQIAGAAASNVVNRVMTPKEPQQGMMG